MKYFFTLLLFCSLAHARHIICTEGAHMSANPNRKYTITEAGVRLKHGEYIEGAKGYTTGHIYNLINAGLLEYNKVGGRRHITEQQIVNHELAVQNGLIDGWIIKRPARSRIR